MPSIARCAFPVNTKSNHSCQVHLLRAFFLLFPDKAADLYDFHLRDMTCSLDGRSSLCPHRRRTLPLKTLALLTQNAWQQSITKRAFSALHTQTRYCQGLDPGSSLTLPLSLSACGYRNEQDDIRHDLRVRHFNHGCLESLNGISTLGATMT
jgi:hypothetical protein